MKLFVFLILSVLLSSFAQESPNAVCDSLKKNEEKNIPLPRQSAYLGKGLSVGVGAGIFNPTEDCDCLGVWQGQLEFFYTDRVSGGIDVRFFGGDLDPTAMILNQRYRIKARFHFPFNLFGFFLSPVFGLESTDIQDFRDEWKNRDDTWWRPFNDMDSTLQERDCEKMFSLDGFSVGLESGFGYRISKLFGVTGDILYEYNFSGAHLLTLVPGVSFSLREFWIWTQKSLSSMWLSLEFYFQRYFNRDVPDWALSGFIGFQVGI